MFTEKKTKSTLSKALALGMVATSVSFGAQTATVDAAKTENNTTSTYKTQTSTKTGTVTAYALNIRKGPSTSYAIVGGLLQNQKVTVTATASNGWYKIKTASGTVGYVSPKYLKVSGDVSNEDNNKDDNTNKGIYVVKSYSKISKVGKVSVSSLNLRKGPSLSYGIKNTLKKGYVVGILKQYSNGWYQVQLKGGTVGYASGDYLKITSGTSSDLKNGSTSTGKENNSNNDSGEVTSSKVQAVVNMVKRQVGKPYVYGAMGPNSFDCSGLTYYCYKNAAGIYLNRSAAAQASNGTYVSKSNLRPGDLVFFNSGTNRIHHVGMYVGNGQFIHAPSPGKSVKYENLYSSYYVKGYVTARRIIK